MRKYVRDMLNIPMVSGHNLYSLLHRLYSCLASPRVAFFNDILLQEAQLHYHAIAFDSSCSEFCICDCKRFRIRLVLHTRQ
jgi:hypothetical protein